MADCVFCKKKLTDGATVTLGDKGCEGIAKASIQRGSSVVVKPGDVVHVECRNKFCHPSEIERFKRKRSSDSETVPTLRSKESFSYKDHCLFCGTGNKYGGKKKQFDLIPVLTLGFDSTIIKVCDDRQDDWAEKVKGRVLFAQDLHAADAVYHQACSVNFRTGKGVPQFVDVESLSKKRKVGRPSDTVRADAFQRVTSFLEENDEEQMTINALMNKMKEFLEDTNLEPYGFTHMKEKLIDHFGERIIITEINGIQNIVTFRGTVSVILNDFYKQPKDSDPEAEKLRLIETAANLIKSDVKSVVQLKDTYPTSLSMSDISEATNYIPESLRLLLNTVFAGKDKRLKMCSLGQAIMQAARPRVMTAPLQLGLGVQMHSHFASRFLIDTLNAHGFCSSYSEVQKYERSAAVNQGLDIPEFLPGQFVQYVADNVDHDTRTLDGSGTFHGMGIMAVVTPKCDVTSVVKRVSVTAEEIAAVGHISIKKFISLGDELANIKYEALPEEPKHRESPKVDLLWKTSLSVRLPRPAWSGYMQMVNNGDHPGQSSTMFLPMIDMNPSDMTCVNSTLHFVAEHAKRYGATPVLTFDQPLWFKATQIVESAGEDSDLHPIILRLGGFHALMSFLGSIGHLMRGTGLQDILEVIFAGNTVTHILTGHAVARAIRGHLLVDSVLHTLLVSSLLGIKLSLSNDNVPLELETIGNLYDDLLSGEITLSDVESSLYLQDLQQKLETHKDMLESSYRTARLWLQYMEMIDIMRSFMRSERIGDWSLHLETMQAMLPYLAASGHNLYTKSLHLYLQKMTKLEDTHPNVYQQFTQGLHVVRRSDRFWAGLSPDLVIEQALMRSLKTSGGLTRGRGMTETQRLVWCLSRPVCAEVNMAMQQLTSITYQTSEQHKDISQARQTRDSRDCSTLLSFIDWRSPFEADSSLRNIVSGISAGSEVNVDDAKRIGYDILNKMVGQHVVKYSFKRKAQAVTFDSKSAVKIGDEEVQIDPLLLFQRLIIAGSQANDLPNALTYELCNYPPALFEGTGKLLKAVKAQLADAIWSEVPYNPAPCQNITYVLDGGALLHRIPWQLGETYDKILQDYTRYVTKHYGQAVVVFDGYEAGPSTKDSTHQRRVECEGRKVTFHLSTKLQLKKKEFLSNKENKQRFLELLGDALAKEGCEVIHARGDADTLIVQTAVRISEDRETVLVGDDTDLLVLLIHLAGENKHDIHFRPEPKKGAEVRCMGVNSIKHKLGVQVCRHILFVHAFLGCDTTSRVFGIGKAAGFKLIQDSEAFREQAEVFRSKRATKDDIITAGEKAMAIVYKWNPSDSLDVVRYRRFQALVTTRNKAVLPNMLPPTSAATKYHSLRVYHQVQEWQGNTLNAEDWGWKLSDGTFKPVISDRAPAPQSLLTLVWCACKSGCGTLRCSCRRHGLQCSPACSGCRGICQNNDYDSAEDGDDSEI
jgi:5'-3' exonuclease